MNINKTTKSLTHKECHSDWWVIDAENIVLGRLAAFVAIILRGKNKATYTPNVDCGDHVIIINAGKIALTGTKADKTKFFWHTGYIGSIRERTLGALRKDDPERLVKNAVKRMLAHRNRSALVSKQIAKLHIFIGSTHKHAAQNPTAIDFGVLNKKNKRA